MKYGMSKAVADGHYIIMESLAKGTLQKSFQIEFTWSDEPIY